MGGEVINEADFIEEIEVRGKEVGSLLRRQDHTAALKKSLENPPIRSKQPSVKDDNAEVVRNVMISIQDASIDSTIAALDDEELDCLMKYVYRFLALPNLPSMLKWHAKIVEKVGVGCIMRTLADKHGVGKEPFMIENLPSADDEGEL